MPTTENGLTAVLDKVGFDATGMVKLDVSINNMQALSHPPLFERYGQNLKLTSIPDDEQEKPVSMNAFVSGITTDKKATKLALQVSQQVGLNKFTATFGGVGNSLKLG